MPASALLDKILPHAAAHNITRLAKVEPTLSSDSAMESVTARMQEKLDGLRRDYNVANPENKAPLYATG
jgi:hypothetical protein